MKIGTVIEKMIDYSNGDIRDIEHFLKVYAFAKTIGEQERLDENTQQILELAAIVHDIACPLCREKYGNCDGSYQETEGGPLAREFLSKLPVTDAVADRVSWLVSHHHTYSNVEGMDYQILLEADFLVNASERDVKRQIIESMLTRVFKTDSGKHILKALYLE